MSETEMVVDASAALEGLLSQRLGAQGNGLGEKVRSIQERLPRDVADRLFYINRERNALMHPPRRPLTDPVRFAATTSECISWLTGDASATPASVLEQIRNPAPQAAAPVLGPSPCMGGAYGLFYRLAWHWQRYFGSTSMPLGRGWQKWAALGLLAYALFWAAVTGGRLGMATVLFYAGVLWLLVKRIVGWRGALIIVMVGPLILTKVVAGLGPPSPQEIWTNGPLIVILIAVVAWVIF